jgi:Pyruvate/2-oxoacid:ferredoxin oxidoreductase gamma subunit
MTMYKEVKVLVVGRGGQGVLTLGNWIMRAAFISGLDVNGFRMKGHSKIGGLTYVVVTYSPPNQSNFNPYVWGDVDYLLGLDYNYTLKMINLVKRNGTIIVPSKEDILNLSKKKTQKLIIVKDKTRGYINVLIYGVFAGLEKQIPIVNFIRILKEWDPEKFKENAILFKLGVRLARGES